MKQSILVAGLLLVLVNAITSGALSYLWGVVSGAAPPPPVSSIPPIGPPQGPRALSPSGQQIPVAIVPGGSG